MVKKLAHFCAFPGYINGTRNEEQETHRLYLSLRMYCSQVLAAWACYMSADQEMRLLVNERKHLPSVTYSHQGCKL